MAKYFSISSGLRGCYMPDSCYVIKVNTRRELKSALAWEADSINDAGFVGLNKKAIAWLANAAPTRPMSPDAIAWVQKHYLPKAKGV